MSKENPKCQKPEKLRGKPGQCSPEQIKECHGEEQEHPCVEEKEKTGCKKPEMLKGKPEECTQEQIKECHGDEKDHPCT